MSSSITISTSTSCSIRISMSIAIRTGNNARLNNVGLVLILGAVVVIGSRRPT